ncbi:MAG: DUF1553 domain-containing protein [Pirellulales bacterium]
MRPLSLRTNRSQRPICKPFDRYFRIAVLACHGPDDQKRGGFRLDDARARFCAGRIRQSSVVPGSPQTSELVRRIKSKDESERMPPREFGKPLTDSEIQAVEKWIAAGASPLKHWAFELPQNPQPPVIDVEAVEAAHRKWHSALPSAGPGEKFTSADWLAQPIDRFVLASQLQRGLGPSSPATRDVLMRRLSLDLTGLPPTPEAVDAFVTDTRPDAYERLVDRLLASPAYGEHWARKWLDLARYADSAGYADDPARTIWAYRDWVVRAFNADMDLEEFTVSQLAGDLLPQPTEDQLIATAFHRNTLTNNEGGTNDEEFRNVAIVDRVNTTMAVWMGITFNCAQCHTHKYDPYTQAEYFQIFDVFNQSQDADRRDESPLIELFTDEQRTMQAELEARRDQLNAQLSAITPALREEAERFESELKDVKHVPLIPSSLQSENMTTSKWDEHGVVTVQPTGDAVKKESYTLQFNAAQNHITDKASPRILQSLRLVIVGDEAIPHAPFQLAKVRASIRPDASAVPPIRFVRIELPGKDRILSLAEVQVFAGDRNVALKGKSSQSSTDYGGDAARAVDGNTSGNYEKNSVTHTASSADPWWEVDLEQAEKIDRVVIWNRTGSGMPERLSGARLILLDDKRQTISSLEMGEGTAREKVKQVNGGKSIPFATAFSRTQPGQDFSPIISGDKPGLWSTDSASQTSSELTLIPTESISFQAGTVLTLELEHNAAEMNKTLQRFRVIATDSDVERRAAALDRDALLILDRPRDKRSAEDQGRFESTYARRVAPGNQAARDQLKDVTAKLAALKPATSVPIMRDLTPDKHRTTYVQLRGNYKSLGSQVSAGIPAVFQSTRGNSAPAADGKVDRMQLARWLMSRQNPLTARVFANRYWESLFGIGIVRTSEEFGSQGDPPSHPELLDWLAGELIDTGWDHKRFLRRLVISQTYRQTSEVSTKLLEADSDNIQLARGPRVRLPAEAVRDQALASAGLLSHKMYGPPVRPPQPSLGLSAAFGSKTDWEASQGEDRYRRGIYTTWRRSNPYPSMATFDAPSREVCTLRRDSTNTPLQALVTLNDPGFVEAAQALARRVVIHEATSGTDETARDRTRLAAAFRYVVSRAPEDRETEALLRLLERARGQLKGNEAAAKQLATEPIGPLPAGADAVELAAWTSVANVLLNLDEVLMKR